VATPSLLGFVWELIHGGATEAATHGAGALLFGDSLVTSVALRLTHPGITADAMLNPHPVAIAAWFGLLVTALNLVPIGQLDGGHVTYALLGRARAERLSRVLSWGLLALALTVSTSWLLWFVITRVVVRTGHPPAIDEAPLTPGRRVVALGSLALFVLTFMPVPISEGFLR
jgi:membrane-associated protease RseP (regulator of RpoE activity)